MAIAVFGGGRSNQGNVGALRDTSITLRFLFKDPTGTAVDVNDASVVITREGVAQTLSALGSSPDIALRYSLTHDVGDGRYRFTFLTTGMAAGMYHVRATGTWTDAFDVVQTLEVGGDVGIGEVSRISDWIQRVRTSLMDDIDPRLYRLDSPVHQWTDEQIYSYLRDALDTLNNFPPRLTGFTADDLPNDAFAIMGARVFALQARARFEKANELTYSDGHTLDIKRADFYKTMADSLWGQWEAMVVSYKRMTPPNPIGLKSQQLPFRVSRVLGLLPNFRTLFSG